MDYKSCELRVVPTAYPEQFWIKDIVEPAPDKGYIKNIVSFSGYFGSHGPHLFAAAPEMYELLHELIDTEGMCSGTSSWADRVRSVISKAEGK